METIITKLPKGLKIVRSHLAASDEYPFSLKLYNQTIFGESPEDIFKTIAGQLTELEQIKATLRRIVD